MNLGCAYLYWGIWSTFIAHIVLQAFRWGSVQPFFNSAATAFIAAGTWMLGTADPSGIGEDRYGRVRDWARGMSLLLLAITILCSFPPASAAALFVFLEPAQQLVMFAWGILLLLYLDRLFSRTKGRPRGFRIRAWLFAGICPASFLAWVICRGRAPLRQWFFVQVLAGSFPLTVVLLYGGIHLFRKSLRAEIAASPNPSRRSTWRFAGSLIYSAWNSLRSKNAEQK
jgi:hypothetical protein